MSGRRLVVDEVAPSDLRVGERIYAYREIQMIRALTERNDHGPLLEVAFEDRAFGSMHFRPDVVVLRLVLESPA